MRNANADLRVEVDRLRTVISEMEAEAQYRNEVDALSV